MEGGEGEVKDEQGVMGMNWEKKHKGSVLDWASEKGELMDSVGNKSERVVDHAAIDDKLAHS